ncbi:MAG: hypothetical protein JWP89_123 [Schlesneria sp.]|nr:hypothetical protein [Schlesneria sp.]
MRVCRGADSSLRLRGDFAVVNSSQDGCSGTEQDHVGDEDRNGCDTEQVHVSYSLEYLFEVRFKHDRETDKRIGRRSERNR